MRKMLEHRSITDEERMDGLEGQLKEARMMAEDADRKYDEVTMNWSFYINPFWCMTRMSPDLLIFSVSIYYTASLQFVYQFSRRL